MQDGDEGALSEQPPRGPPTAGSTRAGRGRALTRRAARILVTVIVAWPAVEMLRLVRQGSHLPWGDYWLMVDTIFREDASTRMAGFLEFHNGHPVVLAKILFWLNIRLGDGSNLTLGYVVMLVAVAQLGLFHHLLRRSKLTFVERSLLMVLCGALIFSMNGSWNFTKSMSGSAWLTANLFAIAAVVLRHHDRTFLAGSSAAVATICYSTGLSAWPAVAAVGLARRPRREWWRELPMAGGFAAGYLWYQSETHRPSELYPSLGELFPVVITLLTAPLRGDLRIVSVTAVLIAVVLGTRVIWRGDRHSAPWLGIAVFGLAGTTTISIGRWMLIKDAEDQVSRYHSLAALFWIGVTGLVVCAARDVVLGVSLEPRRPRRPIALGAVAIVVTVPMIALSWDITDDTTPWDNRVTRQEAAAAALRLEIGEDFQWATGFKEDIDMETFRRRGQYPYSSRWNDDCGLLGTTVDLDSLPESPLGIIKGSAPGTLPGGVALDADVPDLETLRCIVAVAPGGEVVGVGILDDSANFGKHAHGARGALVVAHDGHRSYRVVVYSDRYADGLLLTESITSQEIVRE